MLADFELLGKSCEDAPFASDLARSLNLTEKTAVHSRAANPWEAAVGNLVPRLQWKTLRQWRSHRPEHINLLEFRAHMGLLRRLSARTATHSQRVICIWDSQVGRGASTKGRSSSRQLLHWMRVVLPDILGGNFELGHFWVPTDIMPMDQPSRGGDAPPANGLPLPRLDRESPV